MLITKTRTTIIALLASCSFAAASMAPAISHADPKSGGTTAITCSGGSKPGDIRETTTNVTINGKFAGSFTYKQVCGSDGAWHTVASLVSNPLPSRPSFSGSAVKSEA